MAITLAQLASRYAAASKQVTPAGRKKLNQMAEVGVGLMKRSIQDYHAVDTSTMLNSTSKESVGSSAYLIGPTTNYAPYVALGTSRMAARPFHIKAAQQLQSQIKSIGLGARELGI